ncbi:MAG: 4-alpha-glucanotransferase [Thermoleophilia bacterium]
MPRADTSQLEELAVAYGVQTAYWDVDDRLRSASAESLLATLRVLGAPVLALSDAPEALAERRRRLHTRLLPPAWVWWRDATWPGDPRPRHSSSPALPLQLPAGARPLPLELRVENGPSHTAIIDPNDLEPDGSQEIDGRRYVRYRLPLSVLLQDAAIAADELPPGYHLLIADPDGTRAECTLIAAPRRAWSPPTDRSSWGLFAPLYALRSTEDWGVGDLGSLRELSDWVAQAGGEVTGTLPLLASFLDEPFAPSPYTPVSRLFWNELYLELRRVPELAHCREARELAEGEALAQERKLLGSGDQVDYRRAMQAKRRVLALLSRYFFSSAVGTDRAAALDRFRATHPDIEDYARFRAVTEQRREVWQHWPEPLRSGEFGRRDYSPDNYRYHLYVQLLLEEQLNEAAGRPRSLSEGRSDNRTAGLYLDLPLGVHPGGFDTWRERSSFAFGAAGGAPPDAFFGGGQNWGFPPLHPEGLRKDGFSYLRRALAVQMSKAAYLRIDHVMGLHRLFWIPNGMSATDGVYVRYPAEELYAVFSLESHRFQTVLVGEDLGTVPEYVRPAMAEHGLRRMFVLGYELQADSDRLPRPPRGSLASLNTHDMPPFAGFFRGCDISERVAAGHLAPEEAEQETSHRKRLRLELRRLLAAEGHLEARGPGEAESRLESEDRLPAENPPEAGGAEPSHEELHGLLRAALRFLAKSNAGLLLISLDDLLLRDSSHNLPGTNDEQFNWRLRFDRDLAVLREMPEVREALEEVDRLREEGAERDS